MTMSIVDNTCQFETLNGPIQCQANELTIITDADKAMSAVELGGKRIYVTEAEAQALIQAGATDGRRNLKATDSDSVI